MNRFKCFSIASSAALCFGLVLFFSFPADALRGNRSDLSRNLQSAVDALENDLGHGVRVMVQKDSVDSGGNTLARVVMLGGFRLRIPAGDSRDKARSFLIKYGEILGLQNPSREVRVRRVFKWAGGEVVRLDIVHEGHVVFGRDIAVRLQGDYVTGVSGGLPPVDSWDGPGRVSTRAEIVQHIVKASGRQPSRVFNVGYYVTGGRGVLVWRADQYTPAHVRQPQRFILLVEDRTGIVKVVGRGLIEALGRVYDHTPMQGEPVDLELLGLISETSLEGEYANAYRCSGSMYDWPPCSPLESNAVPDASGNYLYDPVEPSLTDEFAEVHAYYHATGFAHWLDETFEFVWECAGSTAIDVHVNMDYENAFYGDANGDPYECADITLGQGSVDFAYDSEVLFHEFGHGVVDQTAALGCPEMGVCTDDWGLNLIPMGLNEGYADYFSMTYTDNPDIGEYMSSSYGDDYLRSAINLNQCPWDLTSQSHYDGQIWSAVAWTLRESFGFELTNDLIYGVLLSLPQNAEYAVAGQALLDVAGEMQEQGLLTAEDFALVEHTVGPDDRNLIDCYRVIPLDNRPSGKEVAYGYGMQTYPGYLDELPVGIQWTIHVPENGIELRVFVNALMGYGSQWRVFLNENEPSVVQVNMNGTHVFAEHEFEGSPTIVSLDSSSDPALKPNTTYHITIVYSAEYGEFFELRGEVDTGVIEPDAGVIDAMVHHDAGPPIDAAQVEVDAGSGPGELNPRDGCNCSAGISGAGSAMSPIFLALLFLGIFLEGTKRKRRKGVARRKRRK